MHRDIHGMCNDYSCNLITPEGYCRVTACIKATSTTYTTNTELVEIGSLTKITDEGMKKYLQLYFKDHTLNELLFLLADIV